MPRRKKISGAADYILPIGVLVGGGILVYYLINKLGSSLQSGQGANNSGTAAANTSAGQQTTAQLAAAGVNPTMTPAQAANLANQIYTAGLNAQDSSACATINNLITQANNIADVNLIATQFGTKSIPQGNINSWYNTCLSLGINCTSVGLGAFVSAVYGTYDTQGTYLATLNQYMSDQGINYTFSD